MLVRWFSLLLVPALAVAQAPVPSLDRVVLAMGTQLKVQLGGPGDLARASEAALSETARIEKACSTWDPASSWSRLNAAGSNPVALDREWLVLLDQMKTWQVRTEGAFDPALMPLLRAWGIRQGGRTPDQAVLTTAREASGAGLLELNLAAGTARLKNPMAGVEEGGFLKGYALDRMRQAAGTTEGLLDFGGQLLAWGRPVEVAVADPRNRQLPRISFMLSDASLASSGTSERGRHILDPRTGEPCQAWGSTAVVAADALTADVLSTALFVMGPNAGLAWAERHGFAAAFLFNDGGVRLTHAFHNLHPSVRKEQP